MNCSIRNHKLAYLFGIIALFGLLTALLISNFGSFSTSNKIAVKATQSLSLYIADSFPLKQEYLDFFTSHEHTVVTKDLNNADILITDKTPSQTHVSLTPLVTRLFVLVKDFKNTQTNISLSDFQSLISEKPPTLQVATNISQFFPNLSTSDNPLNFVNSANQNYAIIPFEDLQNQYKVISIDNNSPINKTFALATYPLKNQFNLVLPDTYPTIQIKSFVQNHQSLSWNSTNLHSIILTGTTALGRGEYFYIQRFGIDFPNQFVAPIMKNADITEVSDEVSYNNTCQQQVGTMQFCALPSFINTLKDAGVNLVELTGNHNNDFGATYAKESLDLYHTNAMKTFGGGYNAIDARKPAVITLNNTIYCFIGYNQPGPEYAFATDTQAGAARLSEDSLTNDIKAAKQTCSVLFVDVQWQNENNEFPDNSQIQISRLAIDAGADVVTGSSGHRPEGMEFYKGKTIMYGLGNLFFDQMENLDTRQNVIVKHTFYNNNLISTELIPTLLYNYSQPKPAFGQDAKDILAQIWNASPNVY